MSLEELIADLLRDIDNTNLMLIEIPERPITIAFIVLLQQLLQHQLQNTNLSEMLDRELYRLKHSLQMIEDQIFRYPDSGLFPDSVINASTMNLSETVQEPPSEKRYNY